MAAAKVHPGRCEVRVNREAPLRTCPAHARALRGSTPARWRAGRARTPAGRAGRRAVRGRQADQREREAPGPRAWRCRPEVGTGRRGTTARSARPAASPTAPGSSCTAARTCSPERSSVPVTTRSTSASAARALRSGVSPANRAATALERTTREPVPDSDVAIASGRLNARKSDSGSARNDADGNTTRRVSTWATAGTSPVSPMRMPRSSRGHLIGRPRPISRLLGERPANRAIDRGNGRMGR